MSEENASPSKEKMEDIILIKSNSQFLIENIEYIKDKYKPHIKNKPIINAINNSPSLIGIIKWAIKNTKELHDVIYRNYEDSYGNKTLPTHFVAVGDNWTLIISPMYHERISLLFTDTKETYDKITDITPEYYNPGNYRINSCIGGFYLDPIDIKPGTSPILDNDLQTTVIEDIKRFYDFADFYKEHELPHMRGILFHGPPGNGKTSLILSTIKEIKDSYNIIMPLDIVGLDVMKYLSTVLKPEDKKIIILEDIDGVDKYERSNILNFLDGINGMENTIILGTTNYIHLVDAAMVDRPSRFDRIYHIDLPSASSRKKLIKQFFPDVTEDELKSAVINTDEFPGCFFKEIFLVSNLQNLSLGEAIKELKIHLQNHKKNTRVECV